MISRLLIDHSGATLFAEHADEAQNPASLAKMMVLYLAYEAGLNGSTVVSKVAAGTRGSTARLKAGQTVSLLQLALAMIVASGNDAAVAMAEHHGPGFIDGMNAKALELGLTHTVFRTASGLFEEGQTTTAHDMATLALRLYHDFPDQRCLLSVGSMAMNGRRLKNTNTLLFRMPLTGMKTGSTPEGLRHLAASTERVIGIVMGCPDKVARDAEMAEMLAFADATDNGRQTALGTR